MSFSYYNALVFYKIDTSSAAEDRLICRLRRIRRAERWYPTPFLALLWGGHARKNL
jgi:hypothetical protein